MTQLAQAYIHLKPYEASDQGIVALGRYAERIAVKTAAEIYGGGVFVDIEIEEGSLITRITVVGALTVVMATYGHIADYKGFKESVIEICEDAREFAADVCAPFVKKAGIPSEDIYRFERRLKTPGKLYRLGKRLEKLEGALNELSPRDVRRELAKARTEVEAISADLTANERSTILVRIIPKRLPPLPQWPVQDEPHKVVVQRQDEQAAIFFDDEAPDGAGDPKRRVVFKTRKKVAKKKKRSRKKTAGQRALLLEPDVQT